MTQSPPPNDFVSMQEQAIRRVREMQQKAAVQTPQIKESPLKETKQMPPQEKKSEEKLAEPKPEQKEKFESPKSKPPKQENKNSIFSSLLNMDADMSIILPLIFFLGKDGADDVLILALLYIMA